MDNMRIPNNIYNFFFFFFKYISSYFSQLSDYFQTNIWALKSVRSDQNFDPSGSILKKYRQKSIYPFECSNIVKEFEEI